MQISLADRVQALVDELHAMAVIAAPALDLPIPVKENLRDKTLVADIQALEEKSDKVYRLLMNMQPHIPQACQSGRSGFDAALELFNQHGE